MKRGPRWTHRLYAHLFGYFWTSCPTCGREFGGHEWDGQGVPDRKNPFFTHGTCSPECAETVGRTGR